CFADGDTRRIGSAFDQAATGLAEVNRMEVHPIDAGGDFSNLRHQLAAPAFLPLIGRCPERDVMNDSCAQAAARRFRFAHDVDDRCVAVARLIPNPMPGFTDPCESHELDEALGCGGVAFQERRAVKAAYRVFAWNLAGYIPRSIRSARNADQLDPQPVGIAEPDDLFTKSLLDGAAEQRAVAQTLRPELERLRRYLERDRRHLAGAD